MTHASANTSCVEPDAPVLPCAFCETPVHTCELAEDDPRVGGWQAPGTPLPEGQDGDMIGTSGWGPKEFAWRWDGSGWSRPYTPPARGRETLPVGYAESHDGIKVTWRWASYQGREITRYHDYTCPAHPEGIVEDADNYHDHPPGKRAYCSEGCRSAHIAEWRLEQAHRQLDAVGIPRESWPTSEWRASSSALPDGAANERLYLKGVKMHLVWDGVDSWQHPNADQAAVSPKWKSRHVPHTPWRIERPGEGTPVALAERVARVVDAAWQPDDAGHEFLIEQVLAMCTAGEGGGGELIEERWPETPSDPILRAVRALAIDCEGRLVALDEAGLWPIASERAFKTEEAHRLLESERDGLRVERDLAVEGLEQVALALGYPPKAEASAVGMIAQVKELQAQCREVQRLGQIRVAVENAGWIVRGPGDVLKAVKSIIESRVEHVQAQEAQRQRLHQWVDDNTGSEAPRKENGSTVSLYTRLDRMLEARDARFRRVQDALDDVAVVMVAWDVPEDVSDVPGDRALIAKQLQKMLSAAQDQIREEVTVREETEAALQAATTPRKPGVWAQEIRLFDALTALKAPEWIEDPTEALEWLKTRAQLVGPLENIVGEVALALAEKRLTETLDDPMARAVGRLVEACQLAQGERVPDRVWTAVHEALTESVTAAANHLAPLEDSSA